MDQVATTGTAAAKSSSTSPRYWAYCRNERNALVMSLARCLCKRGAWRWTNLTTSRARTHERVTGPSAKRSFRKRSMNQYLGQLRKAEGRLRSMNTAQAGDLVANLGQ